MQYSAGVCRPGRSRGDGARAARGHPGGDRVHRVGRGGPQPAARAPGHAPGEAQRAAACHSSCPGPPNYDTNHSILHMLRHCLCMLLIGCTRVCKALFLSGQVLLCCCRASRRIEAVWDACFAHDGKCSRVAHQADQLLLGLAAGDLPGVGPATKDKLDALGIERVTDVRARSKQALQRELGMKTGASVRAPAPCSHLLPVQLWIHGTYAYHVDLCGLVRAVGPCDQCVSKADMPWQERYF